MSMQLGEEGVRIAAVLSAQAFGKDAAVKVSGDCVVVERATEAIFYIAATTSFYDADPLLTCGNTLDKAMEFGYENLVKSHQEAYRAQYTAMKVTISSNGDRTDTTDRRLKHYREGGSDPDLEALFFNYGRYLLISSSQPDSQPANLQGIWNGQIVPPWDSNYTNNINLQMNYWAVEATGLGQLHQPFFDLVKRMLPAGRRAAQEYYGCRGFVFHHNTDLYGDCAVSSLQSYPWTVGSIWLLMHLWDHYDFNRDLAFLKAEVLPLYLEAVTFFQDFLVEDQDGRLITGFSQSPENACVDHRTGQRSMTSDAPAMDSQLLRDLFTVTRKAMHLTGMSDPDLEQYLDEAVKKLPATKIGSKGQLLEWDVENEELSPDHRHKSHLYAAYPSEQITWNTPELMEAVRTSLRLRTSPNRKPDGWTAAWTSALYARLKEASEAHSNYRGVLEGTHPNLFTGFGQVFQIDANLGAAAAFVEMLLQSHAGVIQPLPACPAEWPEGSVKGMRARGGFLVDMDWKDGALMKLTITSPHGGELSVVLPGGDKKITMLPGDTFAWEEAY
jgi:alpha-L-fucosidase 2